MQNISLQSEYVLSIFDIKITNSFFTSIVVSLLLILLAISYHVYTKGKTDDKLRIGIKVVIYEIYKFINRITENKKITRELLPLITTLFIFILASNLVGLIPGLLGAIYIEYKNSHIPLFKSPNSDLSMTLALAFISILSVQIYFIKEKGIIKYISHYINFSSPLKFVLGFFEILSEFTKIFSFSFRLFGNIYAGEVLLLLIGFFLPYLLPIPFLFIELFVGTIQAFIFAILTLTFVKANIKN